MNVLEMQQVFFPKLAAKLSKELANSYGDWVVWGVDDALCLSCQKLQFLIKEKNSSKFPVDFGVICIDFAHAKSAIDLHLEHRYLISDRFKYVAEEISIESLMVRIPDLLKITQSKTDEKFEQMNEKRLEQIAVSKLDVPVPDGYRSIAWIRKYEADAIVQSYKSEKSTILKDVNGAVFFEATYFVTGSAEAKKFKANVCAIRHRPSGTRLLGWIRREEARAVLDSIESKKSVEFAHIKFGSGGLVQYFDENSPESKRFLSSTRLLRKL